MTRPAPPRIAPPRPPEAPVPYRFPVLTTAAPVVASLAMWALTSSPFALVFAALGPVTAVASLLDSRITARRLSVKENRRFAADTAKTRAEIDECHEAERRALLEVTPSANALCDSAASDPVRWRGDPRRECPVTLGWGALPSSLEFDPHPSAITDAAVAAALARLADCAATLESAPIRVDARLGIAVCGTPAVATALARALGVQVARSLSPAVTRWWSPPGTQEAWMIELPHARAPSIPAAEFWMAFGTEQPVVVIAVCPSDAPGAAGCQVVVRVDELGAAVIQHPERAERRSFRPGVLSREHAFVWASAAADDAVSRGFTVASQTSREVVQLMPLLRAGTPTDGSLACEVGMASGLPVTLDLVADGPHAIIGGTTGSGKSELLVSWIVAMAAAHPPERVTFLLVDFKGGSAFGGLAELPHTVGVITDLDASEAERALESLRAELRFRERQLATHGARSIDQLDTLPRLVIVVDEFAAMLSDHPELHALFADIASRGRSLGVHLILCTQRPAGVVRDSVLANADLRISLRVNNPADSTAVVGTDAAAAIPADARGRAVVARAGEPPEPAQFALAGAQEVGAVATRWAASPRPRRPWCEPLPGVVTPAELAEADLAELRGVPFGLVDLPAEQRRGIACWDPSTDGHLLVLGAARSGCTTALAALSPAQCVPTQTAAAWDAISDLEHALDAPTRERVVSIDDLDSLLGRFPADYRAVFVDRLIRVLRDGPAVGIRMVIAARRLTADLQHIAALTPERLLLRHASRQEFVLAGGEGRAYNERLPPGGGVWRGERVQVVMMPLSRPETIEPRVDELDARRPIAVVSSRPAAVTARLQRAGFAVNQLAGADPRELAVSTGSTRIAIVGEVDEWQSRWGALAALRPVATVLFDGCTPADVRALTRSRELPPPIGGHPALFWRLDQDGVLSRARLPHD